MWQWVVGILIGFMGLLFALWASAETISNFDLQLEIQPDSAVFIEERISYDFGSVEHHGIYRDIPVSYRTESGARRSIKLDVSSVARNDVDEPYTVSTQGNEVRIKIGDANRYVSGLQVYTIRYEVQGALNYFTDFDELYWNATGNGWNVSIDQTQATVLLPVSVEEEDIQVSCYQGSVGSRDSCLYDIVGDKILFRAFGRLSPSEGMTFAIGFPKGIVAEPSLADKIWWWLKDNGVIFLPILVLLGLVSIWYRSGRDPRGRSTIIAEYEPPQGLQPTLVGSLVDERVDNRDLTAGIIFIAEQGFLKIKRLEKQDLFGSVEYTLHLLQPTSQIREPIERDIAEVIFGIGATAGSVKNLSELKRDKRLAKKMKDLKHNINEAMVERGYYKKNPAKLRSLYFTVGGVIIFLAFQFGGILGTPGIISVVISGVLFLVFAPLMTKKTALGAEIKDHILGFKEFISVTDKDRLQFHNAPAKSPEQFMTILPYAVALGVENEWAAQFKDMYSETPNWYEGNFTGQLFAAHLVNDLAGFTTKVNSGFSQAASHNSGSSGGGFSGGGFGGGGGGSW